MNDEVYKKEPEKRSIVGRLINIIFYGLLVIPMIVIGIGWYYSLTKENKRTFWAVVIVLLIIGWLFDIVMPYIFDIPSETYKWKENY